MLAVPALTAEPRFMAVWADGSRTTGEEVKEWNRPDPQPKLGDRKLFEPGNPIRSLRDHTVSASPLPASYLEFIGGDRLPGKAVGFARGTEIGYQPLPPHL